MNIKAVTAKYLVQITNKPQQVIISEVWYAINVILSMKDIVELVMKVGGRAIEAMDLL